MLPLFLNTTTICLWLLVLNSTTICPRLLLYQILPQYVFGSSSIKYYHSITTVCLWLLLYQILIQFVFGSSSIKYYHSITTVCLWLLLYQILIQFVFGSSSIKYYHSMSLVFLFPQQTFLSLVYSMLLHFQLLSRAQKCLPCYNTKIKVNQCSFFAVPMAT